jgi:hypothetical protein
MHNKFTCAAYLESHTCIHTYIHTYVHNVHTYVNTYIHTYVHTCIHAYVHTCIQIIHTDHAYIQIIRTITNIHTYIEETHYTHRRITDKYAPAHMQAAEAIPQYDPVWRRGPDYTKSSLKYPVLVRYATTLDK